MATQVKHRRGTQSEVDSFTGAIGEIVVNTTEEELVLGNGATQGGIPIPKKKTTMLSFDTLSDAVTNRALKNGYTVTLSERVAGSGGGGVWDVVLTSTVTPNGINIIQSTGNPTVSLVLRINTVNDLREFGVVDSVEASDALAKAIEVSNSLDLSGLQILSDPISVTKESFNIFCSKKCAKLTNNSSSSTEFFIKLNTTTADSCVYLDDFTVDAVGFSAKALFVENSTTGKEMILNNIGAENATQEASTGLAAGILLVGGFDLVEINTPKIKDIQSNGGSLVASGIRTGDNGSAVSKRVIVNDPQITGVRPGNDGDGVALLQSFPFTVLGEYEVNGGRFENCHKRAVKTQCWKSIIREPYIVRTEIHVQAPGNIDIDCQYGNAEIINPTFDYSSVNTFPVNGIVSLFGQRGATADNDGRGTNLIGGTATIRTPGRVSHLFGVATFDTDDVVNRISARGFKFNGQAEVVCDIRPVANATFNKNIVFDPVFRDCTFEDISQAFFRLDRSGTGYAFTTGACVIDCSVLSGSIALSQDVTTLVGISYNVVEKNDNIGDEIIKYYTHRAGNIADDAAYSHTFKIPKNASVEVTAMYASGAGNSYHAHRKSMVHCGNGAGEDQEFNWHDEPNFGGSFSISQALVSGLWEITVTKPVGSSSVTGSVEIIAQCVSGITT